MSKLSTRSYVVLGLLAIRDWTTYELAGQMERGFGDIWTASRSMIFEEPKQLVALGLARASEEQVGRRSRTRYGITPKGRTALRRWLAEPGQAPALQFEGLLKVLLAESSDPSTLSASLIAALDWARQTRATGAQVASEYASGRGPFDERVQFVSLAFAFLWDFADLVERWALWAAEAGREPSADRYDVFRRALDGQAAIAEPARPVAGR